MTTLDRLQVADVMLVALAEEIRDNDMIGVGVGTPLALGAALLARATHVPSAHILAGGVVDARVDLATYLGGATAAVASAPGFVSHFESMDMAERQAMTLQFLRPAQVDERGNLNTSRIGSRRSPQVRFPGGLATADVPSLLPRVVVYLPDHRVRNLPDRVSYQTGAGGGWAGDRFKARGVVTLVTNLAVIRFGAEGATLGSIHPGTTVDEVRSLTGFPLRVPNEVPLSKEPDEAQRAALAVLDGAGLRMAEIRVDATSAANEARN